MQIVRLDAGVGYSQLIRLFVSPSRQKSITRIYLFVYVVSRSWLDEALNDRDIMATAQK